MKPVSHTRNILYHVIEIVHIHFSVPSGPPTNISVVNKSPSSITISWLPPDPLDANGVIRNYTFIFERLEAGDRTQLTLNASQLSYTKCGMFFILCTLFILHTGLRPCIWLVCFHHCFSVSYGVIILIGLTPYESLAVQIAAWTSIGRGPFSNITYLRNGEDGQCSCEKCNYF